MHGLKDLFQNNPQLLPLNLAKLVEQVLVAVCDESFQVRHALSILVEFIVNQTPTQKLMPFSSLISAHLNCGLTHIDEKIQIDTLKISGHFLNKPSILVSHARSLLPLLIKLISRRSVNEATSGTTMTMRAASKRKFSAIKSSTLANNPDSKLADQSTMIQVLLQVSKLFEAMQDSLKLNTEEKNTREGPTIDTVNKTVLIPNQALGTHLIDFPSPIPHVPIFRHSGIFFNAGLPGIQSSSIANKSTMLLFSDLQLIMSVLSESLIVYSVNYLSESSKNSKNALLLVKIIFQLIIALLSFAESLSKVSTLDSSFIAFVTKFWVDFQAHSLSRFPLLSKPNFSSFITVLDFYICLIVVKLLERIPDAQNSKDTLFSITAYLGTLSFVNQDILHQNSQHFQTCVEILTQVYPFLLSSSHASIHDLLPSVTMGMAQLFLSCHRLSKSRQLFHKCFGELLKLPLKESMQ